MSMTTMDKQANYIISHVSQRDRYCQLAEEAAELAQAALKVVRAMDGSTNPATIDYLPAISNMLEEIADVLTAYNVAAPWCEDVAEAVGIIAKEKIARWAERLGWKAPDESEEASE